MSGAVFEKRSSGRTLNRRRQSADCVRKLVTAADICVLCLENLGRNGVVAITAQARTSKQLARALVPIRNRRSANSAQIVLYH